MYSTILIQLWQNWTHYRWPVPQSLPKRGAVWSRTVARRWTTRRCRELCATTTAANGRAGRDIWQWWKRRDSTTSKSFRSYIVYTGYLWERKWIQITSYFQIWRASSKLEGRGGDPSEAAMHSTSTMSQWDVSLDQRIVVWWSWRCLSTKE